jgi:tellurite resistance protein TerC
LTAPHVLFYPAVDVNPTIAVPFEVWAAFTGVVVLLLVVDLAFIHRESREMKVRAALGWTAFWIGLALAFNLGVWHVWGRAKALEFLTGYLLEESLSVDNIFVFLMLFSYFKVPPRYQRQVLFWGILGALVLRFVMIVAGTALIQRFHWMIYLFGALLVVTGAKMFFLKEEEGGEIEANPIVRVTRRFLPLVHEYHEGRFVVRLEGKRRGTPLLLVLIVVEFTDVMFALDSIPAIFGVTTDPFIVYTSNVCAILGLRSLFFALSGVMGMFHHLKTGLAAILVFVGIKMCLGHWWHVPIGASLGVIAGILAVSVAASLARPPRAQP